MFIYDRNTIKIPYNPKSCKEKLDERNKICDCVENQVESERDSVV